jgi:hypothetical protein
MDQPYDQIIFFTKTLTGLVMVLNIGLVLSLRAHLRYVREVRTSGAAVGQLHSKTLLALAVLVILVNVATVYCNRQMLQAVKAIAPTAAVK